MCTIESDRLLWETAEQEEAVARATAEAEYDDLAGECYDPDEGGEIYDNNDQRQGALDWGLDNASAALELRNRRITV